MRTPDGMTQEQYENWLTSVKVGDDLPFWSSYGENVYTCKVAAVTPKRIRIGTAEYDRTTGQERGGYDMLTPMTDEIRRQIEDQQTRMTDEIRRQIEDQQTRMTDEIRRQIEDQQTRASAIKVIEKFSPIAWAAVPTGKLIVIAGLLERKVWP